MSLITIILNLFPAGSPLCAANEHMNEHLGVQCIESFSYVSCLCHHWLAFGSGGSCIPNAM